MTTTPETLVGFGDNILADPVERTDAAATLDKVGSDFAQLIVGVGSAVATTQQQLTENSADSTKALANTLVDVIAVQTKTFLDNGIITDSKPILQKLPLLTFVEPVWYEFPQVRIQGRFVVEEFSEADSSASSVSGQSFGAGLNMSLQKKAFSIGGSAGFNSGSQSTSTSSNFEESSAVGQMRMFAQITPRNSDIGIPKPLRVIVGPSLSILAADSTTTKTADTETHTLAVLIQLHKRDGKGIADKSIAIETDGIPWEFVVPPGGDAEKAKKTDADGNINIKLTRTFSLKQPDNAPPVDTTPKPTVIATTYGLVNNRTTVTL